MSGKTSSRDKKKRIKKTFQKIRLLSIATPRARKQMVREGDRELVNCVSECCLNILNGNVRLTPKQKSDLCKHKAKLRTIANKKISLKKKKEIIQKGGFLPLLLGPISLLVSKLLGG